MRIGLAAAVAGLWLSACGAPQTPPVLIEPSQVRPLLQLSDELDGKRVSIDGYIHVANGFAGQDNRASTYTLTSRPRGLGDDLVQFTARRGGEANQMDLPALNDANAFGGLQLVDAKKARYQDASGASHSVQDKVRVTGVLVSGGPSEDDRSPTGQRFRPRLTNVTFEVAP